MFGWHATLPGGGQWGFTSRAPGLGTPPYEGFNLGAHVGDDPEAVLRNRLALAARLAVPADHLIHMDQVHGADVLVVHGPGDGGRRGDAMVTTSAELALVVLVADCVPVLLADPETGVCAVAHAGRAGLVAGVVPAVVAAARARGAGALRAVVGPSVCARCYEVPDLLRAEAAAVSPAAYAVSWTGTAAVDIAAGVVDQLRTLDVPTTWVPGCTREDERYYSHRRGAPTGRFAGVVRLGPASQRAGG